MNITIECPICENRIENNENVEVLGKFSEIYYIKAVCNKCEHFMLFKMNRDGKVIWSF